MKLSIISLIAVFTLVSIQIELTAQKKDALRKVGKQNGWTNSEYSGSRTSKDLRTAMASKGFTWLSGSPADNEKLSIDKNSQFFGFVALRYQSGRAANRGNLGRAFLSILNADQRQILPKIVITEQKFLDEWWNTRKQVLRLFENHLYTGEPINEKEALAIGGRFSRLGAIVTINEAQGFAALEDTLTEEQLFQLKVWREDPEKALNPKNNARVSADGLDRHQLKQLENLYAKAFSWITGKPEDNEVIPLGQPAQFFGFVSIRHKSGHAASRGKIAKAFLEILNSNQEAIINDAIKSLRPVVDRFLDTRGKFIEELASLCNQSNSFDEEKTMELALEMGIYEIQAGWIEAQTYRKIRESMTQKQTQDMMKLRSNYVLDASQVESLTVDQRGAQLAILCNGCHSEPGQYRAGMIGPPLDRFLNRPIASAKGFEYSKSLKKLRGSHWDSENLNQFLANPKTFAPGTKMEFQGLLNESDREALIQHLMRTR